MEFFGVEVPAGNPTTCSPGYGMYLHVTQAALGDSKAKNGKGQERVVVKVQVDPINEIVLGTLSEGKCDQMQLDLVFDGDFTLSHNSKSSSVYICGYRTGAPDEEDDDEDEFEEEEEKIAPVPAAVPNEINGATAGKPSKAVKTDEAVKALAKVTDKAANTVANAIAKAVEKANAKKQVLENDDSDEEDESDEDEGMEHPFMSDLGSDSDDDEFEAGDDSDEDMDEDDDDEDDDDDDEDEDESEDESDESEEEELKTPELKTGKKRTAAEPVKISEKKAKTDASPKPVSVNGKKGGKAAQVTPVGKEAAPKTPTDKGQKPAKTPKGTPTAPPSTPVSAKKIGDHKCTGCDRAFTTESALSQHTAAKHK